MKAKKNAKPMSATLKTLVASASAIGMDVANGYGRAVDLFKKIGTKNKAALQLAGANYKHGYVAVYLKDRYAKRWGNMSPEMMLAEAEAIYAKPYPESSKPNRRTELEHKACRAADVSLATAKRRAGLVAVATSAGQKRKPRPSSNKSTAVPVDLVKASPTLKDKAAANDYFATACAALLTTVNKNAKKVDPKISTAVSDFHAALKAAGFITAEA